MILRSTTKPVTNIIDRPKRAALDPRERLLNKRRELTGQLRASAGALEAAEKIADDDQARLLHDQFVSLRVGRLAHEQLKLIDAALARLDSDAYGICLDCESPIAPKRLAAIPWASRCLDCEERLASQQAHGAFVGQAA